MRNYIVTISISFSLLFAPVMANVGVADGVDELCVLELQLGCLGGYMEAALALSTATQLATIDAAAEQLDRLNACDGDPVCVAGATVLYYARLAEIWAYNSLGQGVLFAAYQACLAGAYVACWIIGS